MVFNIFICAVFVVATLSSFLLSSGWDDLSIEQLLHELAEMDSNNFPSNAGVGEREGRVFSSLVSRRHYFLHHGIGRSGDLSEAQPKAAGSSLIAQLTASLTLHAMKIFGYECFKKCLVVPMATGMTLSLVMLTLRKQRPDARYVLWPRIDQKSCLKSITVAALSPVVIQNVLESGFDCVPVDEVQRLGFEVDVGALDQIGTDMEKLEAAMIELGSSVLCVLSTTSCFAPRRPDKVDRIAALCKTHSIPHVINNACNELVCFTFPYRAVFFMMCICADGLQCSLIRKLVTRACTIGRVDAVVQSTDKNFLVPVGGAIVASPSSEFVEAVARTYAGRASLDPVLDLFITLLAMGQTGLRSLIDERNRIFPLLVAEMSRVAVKHGERLLLSPSNRISIAMSLSSFKQSASAAAAAAADGSHHEIFDVSEIGSSLFHGCVSGTRCVDPAHFDAEHRKISKVTETVQLVSWGAHVDAYQCAYLTAACSMGITERDVTLFADRLDKALTKARKSSMKLMQDAAKIE